MERTRGEADRGCRAVRVRAEDRRCGVRAHVRAWLARSGSHARRRRHGRGHHCQRPHGPRRAAQAAPEGSAGLDRGSRGDVLPGEGVRRPERGADRHRAAAVREPPQRGCGVPAAEGPEGDVVAAPPAVGALVRGGGRHRLRLASGVLGVGGFGRAAGAADHHRRGLDRRGRGVPHELGRAPALGRLGDRRRGDQGRSDGAAAGARRDVARAAVGDRLQVPSRGTHRPC